MAQPGKNTVVEKPETRGISYVLIKESEHEKEYCAKITDEGVEINTKERTMVIFYEGESIHVQVGDRCYDRIARPAYIPLPQDSELDVCIKIKGNLGEKMRDDLTRFSILRPIELLKMKLLE